MAKMIELEKLWQILNLHNVKHNAEAAEEIERQAVAMESDVQTGNKICYCERGKTYTNALIHYGSAMQCVVALEELSECQKEICKALRGKLNRDHLAEEIADATIMLEQMRIFFGVNDLVCRKMDEKIQRLDERLKGENADGETVAKF